MTTLPRPLGDGLILRAAPALERRIAQSPLAGHSSELRLSFYRFPRQSSVVWPVL